MKKGLGIANIKKQFEATNKTNQLLEELCEYLELSETDFINNLIFESSNNIKIIKECEKKLSMEKSVTLYMPKGYLGESKTLGKQDLETVIEISEQKNEEYKYKVEIKNEMSCDFLGDENKNVFIHEEKINDLYDFLYEMIVKFDISIKSKI